MAGPVPVDASAARNQLPREGRHLFVGYLGLLTALGLGAGAAVLALGGLAAWHPLPAYAYVLAGFVLLGELRPLLLPTRWDVHGVPVGTTFLFALLLTVGPVITCAFAALGTVAGDGRRGRAWWRVAFNVAQHELSWLAAAGVLGAFTPLGSAAHPVGQAGGQVPVILAAAAAYYAVNNLLVSTAIALHDRLPLRQVLRRDLGYQALTAAALLALGPLVALTGQRSAWLLPLLALPLLAVYQTAGVTQERDRQAQHDLLTGLPNRLLLHQRVEDMLAAAGHRQGGSDALLLLDLDGFKEVNDTLGHHIGDRLLAEVARRLRAAVRPQDTVARLGGDEFAVLLPDLEHDQQAVDIAGRLHAAIARPISYGDLLLETGASIGIARHPRDGRDVDLLLQRADIAMYRAKGARSGVEGYEPSLDHNSARRLGLLGDLRRALGDPVAGGLQVVYQPIVTTGGQVLGMEALLRWTDPVRGVVTPDEFVPAAEHSSLMRLLTAFVLDQALAQVARWRLIHPNLHVAVNVSARDLTGADFVAALAAALGRHRLPGSALQLEVTERVLATDDASAASALADLAQLGVAVSLDDFGTGYSSLGRLDALPVSEIKIDRSFVARLDAEPEAPLVRSLVEMAHALGLTVVAEGVETDQARTVLQRYGCDRLQGYLLARPMGVADAAAWLARQAEQPPVADARELAPTAAGS